MVRRRTKIDTRAATDEMVVQADRLQHEIGEGPCLDAIWEEGTIYSPNLAYDERWPS